MMLPVLFGRTYSIRHLSRVTMINPPGSSATTLTLSFSKGGRAVLSCGQLASKLLGLLLIFGFSLRSLGDEVATFQDFYALSHEKSLQGQPVRIKALVLICDYEWRQLYLHDGHDVAYFDAREFKAGFKVGQRVELTGLTTGGGTLTNQAIAVVGQRELPAPTRVELAHLPEQPGQWIETGGQVRMAEISAGRLTLVLRDQGRRCNVLVMGPLAGEDYRWLIGARVTVTGVNTSKQGEGGGESAEMTLSGSDQLRIVEPSKLSLSKIPVLSIDALLSRELGSWTNDLVHLNGVVVSFRSGATLDLKDPTGSIRARVKKFTAVTPGERADVWGYLAVAPDRVELEDAMFEINAPAPAAAAPPVAQPGPAAGSNRWPELQSPRDITQLTLKEAAQHRPVRLRGVVTYADPAWHNCYIQDQGEAVYADLNQTNLHAGQWVEVVGQTEAGDYAPEVVQTQIAVLGSTNLPNPAKVELEDLASGQLDSHWVEMSGVVRRIIDHFGHTTLVLTTPKGRFNVLLPGVSPQSLPRNLVDAVLTVRGACASQLNARHQVSGVTLHVPGLEYIDIQKRAPDDPFSIQATSIESLARFDPARRTGRRIKVSGIVTLSLPGQGFILQGPTGGVWVRLLQTSLEATPASKGGEGIRAGERVDVIGFSAFGDYTPNLEEAVVRDLGPAPLPAPVKTTAEQILLRGTNDATRVELDAELVQNVRRSAYPKLVLQDGPIIFTANLLAQPAGQKLPELRSGTRVRLTGVCLIQAGERHDPESFRLLLSQPVDVAVLRAPPWWTTARVFMLAGGLGFSVLLALGWINSLRRQVRAQIKVIQQDHEQLLETSRKAGMAEVASSVLHNVGNVLNSVNVSASMVSARLRESKLEDIGLVAALLEQEGSDLPRFLTQDPRGRELPGYLKLLARHLAEERSGLLEEVQSLSKNIDHIKDIVAMQQSYAKVSGVAERMKATQLLEDALRLNAGALEHHQVTVIREYDAQSPEITVEKHKALQILVNLIRNAKYACDESGSKDKRLTLRVYNGGGRVRIAVIDNGVGIPAENLVRIFNHGFTTRENGHGFGLHSAALAARELGGVLRVHSEGPGRGAAFTLELPLQPQNS
jgi:signal transduction histidine kinase